VRGRSAVAVAFALGALIADASAQPASVEANKLFEEGRALAKAGNVSEACDRFESAAMLDRLVGTLLNLGDCREKLGQPLRAYHHFVDAAALADQRHDERAKFARDRAAALRTKLGTVIVSIADPDAPGTALSIGGEHAIATAHVEQVVVPGSVAIEVTRATGAPFKKTVDVGAGATVTVDVPAPTVPSASAPATGSASDPVESVDAPPAGEREPGRVHLAIGLAAGGGALVIGAGILAYVAHHGYQQQLDSGHCSNATGTLVCDSTGFDATRTAGTEANVATAFAIGALALGAGAAIAYFTAPRELVVAPSTSADQHGVGVTLLGRF